MAVALHGENEAAVFVGKGDAHPIGLGIFHRIDNGFLGNVIDLVEYVGIYWRDRAVRLETAGHVKKSLGAGGQSLEGAGQSGLLDAKGSQVLGGIVGLGHGFVDHGLDLLGVFGFPGQGLLEF